MLGNINYFVIANTFAFETDDYLLYWVWDHSAGDWSDIIQPVVTP